MLGMMSITVNRLIRRRMRVSIVLLGAFVLSDLVYRDRVDTLKGAAAGKGSS